MTPPSPMSNYIVFLTTPPPLKRSDVFYGRPLTSDSKFSAIYHPQGCHSKFEPGKAQYSTPNFFNRLFLIRAYWNPKSSPGFGGLASRGAPDPVASMWHPNSACFICLILDANISRALLGKYQHKVLVAAASIGSTKQEEQAVRTAIFFPCSM